VRRVRDLRGRPVLPVSTNVSLRADFDVIWGRCGMLKMVRQSLTIDLGTAIMRPRRADKRCRKSRCSCPWARASDTGISSGTRDFPSLVQPVFRSFRPNSPSVPVFALTWKRCFIPAFSSIGLARGVRRQFQRLNGVVRFRRAHLIIDSGFQGMKLSRLPLWEAAGA
jgi:hypothetical protein